MAKIGSCSVCGASGMMHEHHKFPQYHLHVKLYPEYIHHPDNIQLACQDCHLGYRRGLIIWNEIEFCSHFKIIPRSKTGIMIEKRKIIDAF